MVKSVTFFRECSGTNARKVKLANRDYMYYRVYIYLYHHPSRQFWDLGR